MEIKIGVQNVPTQLVLESKEEADQIRQKVAQALQSGGLLELTDAKGSITLIPASTIGYVEIAPETKHRVGFGIGS
ncbi:MAG: DUF3107 domain-containing protein [Rothia sp. (in: high G+C Gram-positive bacteria)]|nr:DUF3107 domain-containing protein [Rothia sp. (in: high G+C Gram-positive bacteria)]